MCSAAQKALFFILTVMQNTKNEAGNLLPRAFTFNASDRQVRTVVIDGEPFFVAKDVCDILELTNARMTVQSLDEDERRKYCLPRQGETWLVNESGLYHLIFQSRKPEAKAFRRWVTSEVLPSLRKTGRYELASKPSNIPYPHVGGFIDLRAVPFSSIMLEGFPVRTIRYDDVDWYSLNDIHTAFKTRTDSHQDARRLLMAGSNLAKKLLIFSNTNPAWFVSGTALQLLVSRHMVSTKRNGGK